MPIPSSFSAYGIEIDCLLTWFPIEDGAAIEGQKSRCCKVTFKTTDPPFSTGSGQVIEIGNGPRPPFTFGKKMTPNGRATGSIELGINQYELFSVKVEATLDGHKEARTYLAPPDSFIPFMVNVLKAGGETEVVGTALSLHGTIATGKRAGGVFELFHIDRT